MALLLRYGITFSKQSCDTFVHIAENPKTYLREFPVWNIPTAALAICSLVVEVGCAYLKTTGVGDLILAVR